MANKRRKLTDLYRRDQVVVLNDGNGDPVDVLIRKMSPVDYETAHRKANAKRATILATTDDSSEYYQSTMNEVIEMDRATLIQHLASMAVSKASPAIEAEVASEEKWAKDDFLSGLIDAWQGGLLERYAEDPEDPEAKKVFEAMKEYEAEAQDEIIAAEKVFIEGFELQTDEQLRKEAMKDLLKLNADIACVAEFKRYEIYFSCLNPEDRTRLFGSREEVDELAPQTLQILADRIDNLTVDLTEGKDLLQPVPS